MEFEWSDMKAQSNFKKHAVRFSEAVTIWLDGHSLLAQRLSSAIRGER